MLKYKKSTNEKIFGAQYFIFLAFKLSLITTHQITTVKGWYHRLQILKSSKMHGEFRTDFCNEAA